MATRGFENWTEADVQKLIERRKRPNNATSPPAPTPKRSKYRNEKVVADGHLFDSKREAARWLELRTLASAGLIRKLERQVTFPLYAPIMVDHGLVQSGVLAHVADYIADFTYVEVASGKPIVEDAKGVRTQMYKLKKKWLREQQGIEIQEV